MIEKAQRLSCGNCGKGDFAVYDFDAEEEAKLIVECTKCKSTTVISIEKPRLLMHFGEDSKGLLCRLR